METMKPPWGEGQAFREAVRLVYKDNDILL